MGIKGYIVPILDNFEKVLHAMEKYNDFTDHSMKRQGELFSCFVLTLMPHMIPYRDQMANVWILFLIDGDDVVVRHFFDGFGIDVYRGEDILSLSENGECESRFVDGSDGVLPAQEGPYSLPLDIPILGDPESYAFGIDC